jgi:hypothetical protein
MPGSSLVSSSPRCRHPKRTVQGTTGRDSFDLLRRTRAIHAQLKLNSNDARTRRTAVELLHLTVYLQPAGPDDEHFPGSRLIRISPNDLHKPSSLLDLSVRAVSFPRGE